MRPLTEAEILAVWERGRGRSREEQALAPLWVLQADHASAGLVPGRPAELPVGERDRLLLMLRQATVGPELHGAAACPGCAHPVDFVVGVAEVLAAGEVANLPGLHLAVAGYEVSLRLLDSRDLALAAEAGEVAAASRILLKLAVTRARHDGRSVRPEELPAEVVVAVSQALEAHDPLAVVPLALACTRCGARWQPLLDIASFVWRELEARGERVMLDVHALAQGYGWSETSILGMSPTRRQFYLELVPAERVRGADGEEGGKIG